MSGSELLDRLPPQNQDAERGVIGSMLIDPRMIDEVLPVLKVDDFYLEAHQILYRRIARLHDESGRVDVTLLANALLSAGELASIGGPEYIAEVMDTTPVAAHAVHYAQLVRSKATLRAMIHASTETLRDAWDPAQDPQELLARAEERIFAIGDERSSDSVETVGNLRTEWFDILEKRKGMEMTGVSTGYSELDKMCGGFHASELLILAARPGVGKTALALNIAEHVAVDDRKAVLFVSLEMGRMELLSRILSARARVDGQTIRNGLVSNHDHRKLQSAADAFYETELFIDDTPARTIAEIAAVARRLARRTKQELGLIVIDYLQLIEPDNSRDPRQEQVSKISRQLKQLARKLQVPVLCLAQLNRQVEAGSRDQHPKLSHLRESGAIEQDADVVMFIHREGYGLSGRELEEKKEKDPDLDTKAVLIVAKQRNGPTGEVKLFWRKEFGLYEAAAGAGAEKAFNQYGGGISEDDMRY